MKIGYCRVSTVDQNLNSQLDALQGAGCEKIYSDTVSGKNLERAEFTRMIENLRKGDVLVVYKLDRLSRSLKDLIQTGTALGERGVDLISLNENIDTSTPTGKLIFHMFGAFAEFERDIIRERTAAGLKAARKRGVKGGRKKTLTPAQIKKLKALHQNPDVGVASLQKIFGVSRSTLYRYLN